MHVAKSYSVVCAGAMGLSGLFLLVLAMLGAFDVIAQFLGMPFAFKLELSEVMLASAIFLALPMVQKSGADISIDIMRENVSERWRQRLLRLAALFGFCFQLLVSVFMWRLAAYSLEIDEVAVGYLDFPVWPFKILCATGVSISTVGALLKLLDVESNHPGRNA